MKKVNSREFKHNMIISMCCGIVLFFVVIASCIMYNNTNSKHIPVNFTIEKDGIIILHEYDFKERYSYNYYIGIKTKNIETHKWEVNYFSVPVPESKTKIN